MNSGRGREETAAEAATASDRASQGPSLARGLRRFGTAARGVEVEIVFVPLTIFILVVVFSQLTDRFLVGTNLINVATDMATLAIVAFGVTVVMVGGAFDLSVGSQMALHGSLGAIVMANTGEVWLGVGAGLASGALFGAANGLLVTVLSINPFIATLGTLVIGRGAAFAITGSRPVVGLPDDITGFGIDKPLGLPWTLWLMIAIFLLITYVLHMTPFGLRVFATGGNREAARLSGIRVNRVTVATFMISGVLAAVAGLAVTARLRSGQPVIGGFLELFAVAAVVLGGTSLYGGRGATWRTLSGVLLIAVVQNGLNLLNVSSPWQQMTIGLIFLLAASSEKVKGTQLGRPRGADAGEREAHQ